MYIYVHMCTPNVPSAYLPEPSRETDRVIPDASASSSIYLYVYLYNYICINIYIYIYR